MTADLPVLDLDSPDPDVGVPPDPLRLREIRVPLWLVPLVAIGCVVVAAVAPATVRRPGGRP